jgi:hypothetical protein
MYTNPQPDRPPTDVIDSTRSTSTRTVKSVSSGGFMFYPIRLIIRESRIVGTLWYVAAIAFLVDAIRSQGDNREEIWMSAGSAVIGIVCWIGAHQRDKINEKARAAEEQKQQGVYDAGYQAGIEEAERNAALVCPDCNHENQEDWSFCSSCGSRSVR